MAVELSGGEAGDVRDIVVVGEALAGVGGATKAPPPRLDEIEPARADGDEDLLNTRMGGEPVTDGTTRVTRKVVEPVEKSRCGCSSLGAEDALRAIHTLRAGILGGFIASVDARPVWREIAVAANETLADLHCYTA